MAITLDEALARLETMKASHLGKSMAMMRAYGTAFYMADMLCMASLNRSMSLIEGFMLLIRAKNFMCAAPMVRLQLDTLLRMRAMWLVDEPHDFASKVLSGEPINKMVDRHGKKLSDRYLVESMKAECPWIEEVYEETCGYVHFSYKHYFNAMQPDASKDRVVHMAVGAEDHFISDEQRLEAVMAFIDITGNIFRYIDGWTFTKAYPDIAADLRAQRDRTVDASAKDGAGQGPPPASKEL